MSESGQCSCGIALESRLGTAYNQEAFRYFLAIERERAEAVQNSVVLVLVRAKREPTMYCRLSPSVATEIFAAMWLCFRDVDVIGWFRQDRVAGVVLTAGAEPPTPEVARLIALRITKALDERVSFDAATRLHVRVLRLGQTPAH
jgi:hypothetical protein